MDARGASGISTKGDARYGAESHTESSRQFIQGRLKTPRDTHIVTEVFRVLAYTPPSPGPDLVIAGPAFGTFRPLTRAVSKERPSCLRQDRAYVTGFDTFFDTPSHGQSRTKPKVASDQHLR